MTQKDFRRDAKVLLYDLEVAPRLGYYYGTYEVTPIEEVRPPILLSVAWKWLGDKKANCLTLYDRAAIDPYNDKLLVNELWNLLDEANIVVAHNGKRFDDKMSNYFFIKHDMDPPSPYKEFDTLQTAKKYFKFDCNKLDYLGKMLAGQGKTEVTYGDCWKDLLEGNKRERKKASDLMKKYNCLTPDHKVLGTDLRWHEIGSLSIGDTILGFSENENTGTLGRTYQKATVLGNRRVIDDVYKVTLSNGDTIKCTKEHQWLTNLCSVSSARNEKLPGGKKWRKTEELVFRGQRLDGTRSTAGNQFDSSATVIQKLMPVWEENTSKNAGWLAGMLDGEGSLSNRKQAGGFMLNISQKVGPELDRLGVEIQKYTERRLDMHLRGAHNWQKQPIGYYTIKGKFWEKLRFLGEVRPERLIANINWDNLPRMEGRNEAVWVKNIEYLGKQEIVILETDTHTYIADGYPMHNCRDVEVLEKIYQKMLPWATNHPNMALYAQQEHICPRCGNDSDFEVKSYRRTGMQVNAIQYKCKHCGGYVTRKLTKEEREELDNNGCLKSTFRNMV